MIDFTSNVGSGGGASGNSGQVSNASSNLPGATSSSLTASMLNSFRAGTFGVIGGSSVGTIGQNHPPSLDINEFPSLGGGGNINSFSSNSSMGRPAYVGMVKETVGGAGTGGQLNPEFNIQPEDFPALPGSGPMTAAQAAAVAAQAASNAAAAAAGSGLSGSLQFGNFSTTPGGDIDGLANGTTAKGEDAGTTTTTSAGAGSGQREVSPKKGMAGSNGISYSIQFTKEGHPLNAPAGLLSDQFGIVGFVHLLQTLDGNPNLRNMMLGFDAAAINLNLNSKERIHQSYSGPWCDRTLRPYEIDYPVPQEYLIYNTLRDKLAPVDTKFYNEDTLFFLFYCFAGEEMQQVAAQELYKRDWRFHKEERSWICRRPGAQIQEKQPTYERGQYIYFDPNNWIKNTKEMLVEYDRLEPPPPGMMQNV